jgi:uncharacterized membrane protein YphA (DoxX/SURF4 family)/thiol-disulfide isomerase/thioredoxin
MKKSLFINIITYFFICLFLYTGVSKLIDIPLFKEQLTSSPFTGPMAGIFAWALPIIEILLAIALFIPKFQFKALYATLILMTCFTIYVIALLFIDSQLSCSCGGIIEELSPKQHVLFNSTCVILSVVAIVLARGQKQRPTTRIKWLTGTSVIGLFAVIGWILFAAFTAPATPKTGMEGRLLPDFDLLLPDSVTHFNTANIPTGKPFVVIGFDPFCAHCQAETQDIIKNIQRLKNVSIYYVTPYPLWEIKAFYQHFKLERYPNITIGRDYRDVFFREFRSTVVPYTAVFDSRRRLKQVFAHQTDAKSLATATSE